MNPLGRMRAEPGGQALGAGLPGPLHAVPAPARSPLQRALYFLLACASLCLAVAGAFLPGLPSTEFVLLASWAAARSSPRLHHWLHAHPWFGPLLRNWRQGRRVSRAAKISATVSMTVCLGLLIHAGPPAWVAWPAAACMAGVLAWLWRRPEPDASQSA